MTFEYRNAANDRLAVAPLGDVVWLKTTPGGCEVPPDRVEEVVAGIRDAARQAAGQTTQHHIPCGQCGAPWSDGHGQPGDPCPAAGQIPSGEPDARKAAIVTLAMPCDTCAHTLNWHRNDVGCTLDRCACGRFREPEQPAVEQPAEAQPAEEARPPRVEWRIELLDVDGWMPSGLVRPDRDLVAQYLAGRRKQRPDATFRLVRETTTWTVEETR